MEEQQLKQLAGMPKPKFLSLKFQNPRTLQKSDFGIHYDGSNKNGDNSV